MKKLVFIIAITLGGLFYNTANAQFMVHLVINLFPRKAIIVPRADAPLYANANYNENYYYLPDVGAYYNINEKVLSLFRWQ